jgi:choline dehydrogenase-like flavoprotein
MSTTKLKSVDVVVVGSGVVGSIMSMELASADAAGCGDR